MPRTISLMVFRLIVAMAAIILLNSRASADPSATPRDTDYALRAVWTPKRVHFTYMGLTTHYSCDGLKEKVREALLELGARKDLEVHEGACQRPATGPEPFPNVEVRMNVLQPVADNASGVGSLPARWERVDLKLDRDLLLEAEDCELVEQIEHTFLPLFTTRNVDYQSNCAVHQVLPGGTYLRVDVLAADQKDSKAVASIR
jgi:hypothetical protein